MAIKYVLKLYVTGETELSLAAIKNLKKILDENYKDTYSLEIIDVIKNPKLAEEDKILTTPTVIKLLPPPIARLIGELKDKEKVLQGLSLEIAK